MAITLPITSPYTAKDQLKADKANKFIGRGSLKSSTHAYMLAYGNMANCGQYESTDTVFISAEGLRAGRKSPDTNEIKLAADAKVTFITDKEQDRDRPYNGGERQVALILDRLGYIENKPGTWIPKIT